MRPATQLVVASVLVSLLSVHAAAQDGYKLVVRGGPGVVLDLSRGDQDGMVNLTVNFKPGTKPAGPGLGPGQGSWADRGLNADEPARLVYRVKRARAQGIAASLRNPRVTWAFWCNNSGNGYMSVTRDAQAGGPPPSGID